MLNITYIRVSSEKVLGELTYEQAAAVTSIGASFKSNTKIAHFNEFKYFTKITSFNTTGYAANGEFNGCSNLIDIDLTNITFLSCSYFVGCSKLKYLRNLRSSVVFETSGNGPIYQCSALEGELDITEGSWYRTTNNINCSMFRQTGWTAIRLPLITTTISGNYVFYNATRLRRVIIASDHLVNITNSNALTNLSGSCNIYVPNSLIENYKAANYWKNIASRIYPLEETWWCWNRGDMPEYMTFEDSEVGKICANNWGDSVLKQVTEVITEDSDTVEITTVYTYRSMLNTTVKKTDTSTAVTTRSKTEEDVAGETTTSTRIPLGITREQAAAVSSLGTVFNSNSVITKFNELKYFTNVHSINNGFVACTSLTEVDLSNITSLGTGALQSSGIIYVYAPLARSASQGSGSTGWAASTRSLIGCLWKSLTSISVGGMYNSTNKYHIFLRYLHE